MGNKIYPRNLTAHLSHSVAGNPAVSRLESSVANCFPGLEMDVRNLDRRFFPGLLFNYVGGPDAGLPQDNQQGVKLLYVDPLQDPMLPESATLEWQQVLLDKYNGAIGDGLSSGDWYLHSIEQGGNRIELYQFAYFENSTQRIPYEAETVWWLVRGLTPRDIITIELAQRDASGALVGTPVSLTGYRRRYVDEGGTIAEVYRPGEMTESLCSPWTHDFRDCACHYWAASHPDVVLGEVGEDTMPSGGSENPITATNYVDWLRADRGPSGASQVAPTITVQRPLRIDQYAINQVWEELAFVLEGREIGDVGPEYDQAPIAKPYASIHKMIEVLETELAPLEMSLAVQYLYAMFSIRSDDEISQTAWVSLKDDIGQVRQFLMLIAAGEMQHLRWVNQLLWELDRAGLYPEGKSYKPVLKFARNEPGERRPALKRLEPDVLDEFIDYESPGGDIFRGYARCVATLRDERLGAPKHLYELAVRIDSDGLDHYSKFCDLKVALSAYAEADGFPYLRDIQLGDELEAERGLALFADILDQLEVAFVLEASGNAKASQAAIDSARDAMHALNIEGEALAKAGVGIPFFRV